MIYGSMFSHIFQLLILYFQLGMTNCESCKSFSSEITSSTGSIMALSGDLKCLCLGESLNIYATSRIILENELYSSQGKAKSVETAVHGKLEETS